jgi:hypothetical protein
VSQKSGLFCCQISLSPKNIRESEDDILTYPPVQQQQQQQKKKNKKQQQQKAAQLLHIQRTRISAQLPAKSQIFLSKGGRPPEFYNRKNS